MKILSTHNAELVRGTPASATDKSVIVDQAIVVTNQDGADIIIAGTIPVPSEQLVAVDNVTVGGAGVGEDPLHTIPGGTGVAVDNVSISGDGTNAMPLHTNSFETKVLSDGITIVGSGIVSDPLIATGGGPGTTNVQPFDYTVIGTEPDLANLTIPISPSQPDGDYFVTVSQGPCAFAYGMQITAKAGASLVLSLSYPATAGDVFDFQLARTP
jgi:hypothetical protein